MKPVLFLSATFLQRRGNICMILIMSAQNETNNKRLARTISGKTLGKLGNIKR